MNALSRIEVDDKIHDLAYVKGCLEHWSWRCRGFGYGGGISPTGRLMHGMTTNCRCAGRDPQCYLCDGTGRVSGDLRSDRRAIRMDCDRCLARDPRTGKVRPTGEIGGRTCAKCRGRGRRLILFESVNPASIPSTKFTGGKGVDDRIYHVVEDVVRGWKEHDETVWLNKVTVREYLFNGTQEMKAMRLRISPRFYGKQLHEAHWRFSLILRPE